MVVFPTPTFVLFLFYQTPHSFFHQLTQTNIQGAPMTSRLFHLHTLPYLKPALPRWLHEHVDSMKSRAEEHGLFAAEGSTESDGARVSEIDA